METSETIEEKKPGKLQWFFFTGIIPILFAVVVALIVFSVAGINVFEKGKAIGEKVPYISNLFNDDKEKNAEKDLESKIVSLEGEVKDREAKIEELEDKLKEKDKEIEKTNLEKEQLKKQIEELQSAKEEQEKSNQELIKTFESISARKAAPILTQMNEDDAVEIMLSLKSDTLAAILEKMDSADAAKFTELLEKHKKAQTQTQTQNQS